MTTHTETIRTLSANESKRIKCQATDCKHQAELSETVRLYTGSLAFYYFCHACWKAKELKDAA